MAKTIWMVRSGGSGLLIEEFLGEGVVAVGWNDIGRIPIDIEYADLKRRYIEIFPGSQGGSANQNSGQIWRFIRDIKIGDYVVTYDPGTRLYFLGKVLSDYFYDEKLTFRIARRVEWSNNPIARDGLSIKAKNSLGSVLTVFLLPEFVAEELEKAPPVMTELTEEDISELSEFDELNFLKTDVINRSKEFIIDLIAKLSWQDTESLVAGILKAMGYKVRLTQSGSDLGSDILASPDGLGLEEPRIKVEVKKRTKERIGAPDVRNFIGGMRSNDRGIYVATTGFSKEARYEAERANFPIRLIDSDLLVDLVVENYELFSPETKALIPLRKIYWPV